MYGLEAEIEDWTFAEQEKERLGKIKNYIAESLTELGKMHEMIKRKNFERQSLVEYREEAMLLSSENNGLKEMNRELSSQIESLRQQAAEMKKLAEDEKKRPQENLQKLVQELEKLKQKFGDKEEEVEQLKEFLSRNETSKNMKVKCQNLIEHYAKCEEKAKKYDFTAEQLTNQSTNLSTLELKHTEDQEVISRLTDNMGSLKYSFELQKQHWYKKERAYQNSIQSLLSQLESSKLSTEVYMAEALKLKKSLTLHNSDEAIGNFTKEEILRYQARLNQAELLTTNLSIEIDQLHNTHDYYRNLLNSKNEIISQLELKVQDLVSTTEDKKQGLTDDHQEIKDILAYLRSSMICQNCCDEKGTAVVYPCGHLVCDKCRPEQQVCSVCSLAPCYSSPSIHLNVLESLNKQLEELLH
jgi:DNA repair exonuclease SbcCD ATPase subunit